MRGWRKRWRPTLSSLLGLLFVASAHAQDAATVVTSCGTAQPAWSAGQVRPLTQDLTGTLCTGMGGGSGGSVTQGTVPWVVSASGSFPITAASLPLPAGASTSALQGSILAALGSPFQAGGSIGNTTFAATQGTSPWVVSAAQSGAWALTAPIQITGALGQPVAQTTFAGALKTDSSATVQPVAQVGQIVCNNYAKYDSTTSGDILLVNRAQGGLYVCGYAIMVGSTATNVKLEYGTGTACGTGTIAMTPAWQIAANGGIVINSPLFNGLFAPPGKDLCLNTSAGNAVQASIYYAQQ